MLIPIKKVASELGISVTSVRALVKQGKLEKHKLAITGGGHAARYDSDEVAALRQRMKRSADAATPPGQPVRPSRRAATAVASAPGRRAKAVIDFG